MHQSLGHENCYSVDVIVDVLTLWDKFTVHNPVEKKEEKPKQK